MNTTAALQTIDVELKPTYPSLRIYKYIPPEISRQLEKAVEDFMVTSNMPSGLNAESFYYRTLQSIANATYLGGGGEFWLAISNGELWGYSLCFVSPDFDGKLSYMMSQSWIRKDQRRQPWVKWAISQIRQRAKDCFCSHFATISTRRNDAAYCRWLGKGFHKYSTILKEEL